MTSTTPKRDALIAEAREHVASLRVSYIDTKPKDYDFGERFDSNGECRWEFIEAVYCDSCERYIVGPDDHAFINPDGQPVPAEVLMADGEIDEDELVEWAENSGFTACDRQGEGYTEFDSAEGPMMNYRYQIDDELYTNDAAHKIAHLPLCLVRDEENENVYLALTGGGMDLSWEICEAYIRLGYLPPSHFDLPEMAGKELNERNALIVAAVERSNEILASWAQRRRERATNLLTSLIGPDEAPFIVTEDGKVVHQGDRAYNYYDCKWCTVGEIDSEGWATCAADDGTSAALNGARLSSYDPQGSTDPKASQ
jgi:hypothetical protein